MPSEKGVGMKKICSMFAVFAVCLGCIFLSSCGGGSGLTIVSVDPANNATGIAATAHITVVFSGDLDPAKLTAANITLTRGAGVISVTGSIAYDSSSQTMTFTPTSPMLAGTPYTFTIKSAVGIAADNVTAFTTLSQPLLFVSNYNAADPSTPLAVVNLWAINADGSSMEALTNYTNISEGNVGNPFYLGVRSPDYSQITFNHQGNTGSGNTYDAYVMHADGSAPLNLTNGTSTYTVFTQDWLRDSSGILYVFDPVSPGTQVGNLAYVRPDGTGYVQLTNYTGTSKVSPFYYFSSPDGTSVYYLVGTDSWFATELHAVNIDGTNDRLIVSAPAGGFIMRPVLSADGTKIYYTSGTIVEGMGVYSMNLDGSNQQTIWAPAANQGRIISQLSPRGNQLAVVVQDTAASIYDIYMVNIDGSSFVKITNSTASEMTHWVSSWSPDGSRLAYLFGNQSSGPLDLYVVNSDGSGNTNLTNYTGDNYAYDGYYYKQSLSAGLWSPDGSRIYFTRTNATVSPAQFTINSVAIDGSGESVIVDQVPARVLLIN